MRTANVRWASVGLVGRGPYSDLQNCCLYLALLAWSGRGKNPLMGGVYVGVSTMYILISILKNLEL